MATRRATAVLMTLATTLLLNACVTPQPPPPPSGAVSARYEAARWPELPGWRDDQAREAWSAFLNTCAAKNAAAALKDACIAAQALGVASDERVRAFFESNFTPYRVMRVESASRSADTGLVTGYYEPLLRGSRKPSSSFATALYAPPDDLLRIELADAIPELKGMRLRGRLQGKRVVAYPDRAGLRTDAALKGKELVWVDSAVDAFFLEVQGSGRVQLDDGSTIRLAFADQNGRPYRPIGRYLVERGELQSQQVSAPAIRQWLRAHPDRLHEVLDINPSVVFFREEAIDDPARGPKGALGVPLTPGRSVAVDTTFIPLGAPLFLSTTQPASEVPLRRLVMAQDTGGAIRGPLRIDLFWGFGAAAGEAAGTMQQPGQVWLLWPRHLPLPNQ